MSKRMVTYQVGDDKIVSIDGHDVGTGGVGDKSISRRMITYKVDDAGKITSIDGHELNGGGGGDYEIKALEVTQNGVYDVGGEAYKPVRVNVPQTAQSGTLKAVLDATQQAEYLFNYYEGTSVDGLISFNDTSNVKSMYSMFYACGKLTAIPRLDVSNVTNMQRMFYDCKALEEIHITGIKVSFDIHYSTKFTRDALVEILNNLAPVTSTQTLTMGATNLAKLTDDDKAIATNKGWQLA